VELFSGREVGSTGLKLISADTADDADGRFGACATTFVAGLCTYASQLTAALLHYFANGSANFSVGAQRNIIEKINGEQERDRSGQQA